MVTAGTIAVGAVVVSALLTLALLVIDAPRVGRGTAVGAIPWMVAAGLLHALGAYGAYPAGLRRIFLLPVGLLLTFVVASVLWVLLVQFATLRNVEVTSGRYVSVAGTGTAVVLFGVLVLLRPPSIEGVFWLATTPVISAVVAGIGILSLGVLDATALARMRWVGWLVAFGFTFLGTVVAVGIDVFGTATTPATGAIVSATGSLPTASVSVAWPLVVLGAVLGIAMVSALARVVEEDPASGFVLAVALGAGTVTPSVALFLTTVLR